jgi:AcrR family transcriptional regulator
MAATSTDTDASRPRRADALRNRERVLEGAWACFAEAGLDAQMHDVAERAGVGVGTVYRHFATRDALLDELCSRCLTDLVATARRALTEQDAWTGFESFVWHVARKQHTDRVTAEVLPAAKRVSADGRRLGDELTSVVAEIALRAQGQGSMRDDLTADSVPPLVRAMAYGVAAGRHVPGFRWGDYVRVMLDGLRAR